MLFSDIVSYTNLSSEMQPSEVRGEDQVHAQGSQHVLAMYALRSTSMCCDVSYTNMSSEMQPSELREMASAQSSLHSQHVATLQSAGS